MVHGYPQRKTARNAMVSIKAIHEWENCREDSAQFKEAAEVLNRQFEAESTSGHVPGEPDSEVLTTGESPDESENEEEDDDEYDSSFIDDDSIHSLSDDEEENEEELESQTTTDESDEEFDEEKALCDDEPNTPIERAAKRIKTYPEDDNTVAAIEESLTQVDDDADLAPCLETSDTSQFI